MRAAKLLLLIALPTSVSACLDDGVATEAPEDLATVVGAVVNPAAPRCPANSPSPGPLEVYIYPDPNFPSGTCRVLSPGFYPSITQLAIPQDSMSSIKVGSGVRFRTFRETGYGGTPADWFAGGNYSALSAYGWDNVISSARVVTSDRSTDCSDLRDQELAMFRDRNLDGTSPHDCVVVVANTNGFPTPDQMGIKDDSVSSFNNNSDMHVTFMGDPNFHHTGKDFTALPRTAGDLPHDSGSWPFARIDAIEDSVSGVRVTFGPPVW